MDRERIKRRVTNRTETKWGKAVIVEAGGLQMLVCHRPTRKAKPAKEAQND